MQEHNRHRLHTIYLPNTGFKAPSRLSVFLGAFNSAANPRPSPAMYVHRTLPTAVEASTTTQPVSSARSQANIDSGGSRSGASVPWRWAMGVYTHACPAVWLNRPGSLLAAPASVVI